MAHIFEMFENQQYRISTYTYFNSIALYLVGMDIAKFPHILAKTKIQFALKTFDYVPFNNMLQNIVWNGKALSDNRTKSFCLNLNLILVCKRVFLC